MMDLTVICGTFGDNFWIDLAHERARPSVITQGVPFIHRHGDTLAEARNAALHDVTTEWVVCLDADDELEPGFATAMAQGTMDVRAPSVRRVRNDRVIAEPHMPRVFAHDHDCVAACLPEGNWLVVGSAARTTLLRDLGGWLEEAMYEDWSLWLRAYAAGATFEAIPAAVYRAYFRRGSRNRAPSQATKDQWHWHIYEAYAPRPAV